jgi:hypothetical protein
MSSPMKIVFCCFSRRYGETKSILISSNRSAEMSLFGMAVEIRFSAIEFSKIFFCKPFWQRNKQTKKLFLKPLENGARARGVVDRALVCHLGDPGSNLGQANFLQ